jgi:hypothetical protein
MTTEELAELFLAHLYSLAEEAPHPNFLFSVNDFAPKLGLTDREELQKAINCLGDRGLIIIASFDMFGGISAGITIEGSVFVEMGGETGIIGQYRKSPQTFTRTPSEPSSPAVDRTEKTGNEEKQRAFIGRRAAEAILSDIEDILEKDETVAAGAKEDLFSDLTTLKIQMGRNVKDKRIIDASLGNLSAAPSIAPLVTALNSLVEAYFQ